MAEVVAHATEPRGSTQADTGLGGLTAVVVDDDPAIVRALERLFRRAGFPEPHGITDPTLARDLVRSGGFDLVILDLHMPEMDGFAVMASLRQVLEPEEYLPILVLTGDDHPALRREALNAGAMDFLNKPFEPSEAEARARNLLATRFLTQRVAHQRDSMEEARQSRSSCSPTRPSAPRSPAAAPTGSSRSPATSP